MPEAELTNILAETKVKGYVIAPAGFGKTQLIASAVKNSDGCQLILTHTFAGVNSLKKKMKLLGVPGKNYRIETIASWSLRICLAFPENSTWHIEQPEGNKEWAELYSKCSALLTKQFVVRIIQASYKGVYVDEYQDCSIFQHELVCSLANIIPCRILGDPMQAIFDFAEEPVNWEQHIYPYFIKLGELTIPWRWKNAGADKLGEWLIQQRASIENNSGVDISKQLPPNVRILEFDMDDYTHPERLNIFYNFAKIPDSVMVIYPGKPQFKNKTHLLSKTLSGIFSSIEEVEGVSLFSFIKKIMAAKQPAKHLENTINFASSCMTHVNDVLSAGTKRYEISSITKATKYPELTDVANCYLNDPSSENLRRFLLSLKENPETRLFRKDLFNRAIQVFNIHIQNPEVTIEDAAKLFQKKFRHSGRPTKHNKLIGTTLLVKGLEYDHAVIVDTDFLSPKELYVALTRASKTLMIVTKNKILLK